MTMITKLYAAVALSMMAVAAHASPTVGAPAPAFSGLTANGETLTLESLKGRPVVLEWTNHQCPYVGKHYRSGNMQKTQRTLTEGGAEWISVISSAPGKQGHVSAEEALEIATKNASYADHIILDENGIIGRMYDAKTTPHMFMIDEEGVLQYQGAIDDIPSASERSLPDATNLVLAAWDEFKAGEPITEPVSKAYGCTIKY